MKNELEMGDLRLISKPISWELDFSALEQLQSIGKGLEDVNSHCVQQWRTSHPYS